MRDLASVVFLVSSNLEPEERGVHMGPQEARGRRDRSYLSAYRATSRVNHLSNSPQPHHPSSA